MTGPRPIIWLAMSAFDDPQRLGSALKGLVAHDVRLAEIGVAGTPSAVDGMRAALSQSAADWQQFVPLFSDVEPVPFIPVIGGVVATSGRLMTPGEGAVASADCLIPPAQRLRLAGSMTDGAVLLLANPSSQDRWTRSTRVLLRHSAHPVQSHEIALPHPQGMPNGGPTGRPG